MEQFFYSVVSCVISILLEEIPSQEPSRNRDIDNTAPSESESSDTNSCVEFHDSSEKRHSAFRNKRRRMLTDARR